MKIEINPLKRKKRNRRHFTLLEVMIVVAIVAIAGGSVFWRLRFLMQSHRIESDARRLRELLFSSRMLAINTKSDIELEILSIQEGWSYRLIALEELGKQISSGRLSPLKLQFEEIFKEKEAIGSNQKRIVFRFFSTGCVAPFGKLKIEKEEIGIPAFFRLEQGKELGPVHPDDLKK